MFGVNSKMSYNHLNFLIKMALANGVSPIRVSKLRGAHRCDVLHFSKTAFVYLMSAW